MSTVAVDTGAYMALMHELRAYRDAAQLGSALPDYHLRKGVITARDPASYSVSVMLGSADTAEDEPGVAIDGVALADTVYPRIGASCFVSFNGPDPTVLYTIGEGVGRVRAFSTVGTDLPASANVPIQLNSDVHDRDTMHLGTDNTKVFCRWPGQYNANGAVEFVGGSTTGVRRILDLRVTPISGTGAYVVGRYEWRFTTAGTDEIRQVQALDFEMLAGDYLELVAFQAGGGTLSTQVSASPHRYTPLLEVVWTGPPVSYLGALT
jgi:hypothetical protein